MNVIISGTKELFIDKCLLRPLDMIATSSDMKRHGVKRIMHFDLQKSPQVNSEVQLYLVIFVFSQRFGTSKSISESSF